MTHAVGTHLDGVRTIAALRGRCVVDADTGCWHYRSSRGKPMPRNKRHAIWSGSAGASVSVLRFAWELKTKQSVPPGQVVYRTCCSYDCVHHIACGTKADQGQHQQGTGALRGDPLAPARNRRNQAGRIKVTDELAQWIRESGQNVPDMAHALDVSINAVYRVRAGISGKPAAPSASVFHLSAWRPAPPSQHQRKAA